MRLFRSRTTTLSRSPRCPSSAAFLCGSGCHPARRRRTARARVVKAPRAGTHRANSWQDCTSHTPSATATAPREAQDVKWSSNSIPATMRGTMAKIPSPNRDEAPADPSVPLDQMPAMAPVDTLSHSPALARQVLRLAQAQFTTLELTARNRELLILTVAAHVQRSYEYEQHIPISQDARVSPTLRESIWTGKLDSDELEAPDRADRIRSRRLGVAIRSRSDHDGDPAAYFLARDRRDSAPNGLLLGIRPPVHSFGHRDRDAGRAHFGERRRRSEQSANPVREMTCRTE